VVKPTTIRIVLSNDYSASWSIKQIDIQNTFLHGILTEENGTTTELYSPKSSSAHLQIA
jgi:hypothetical protein